MAGLDSRLIHWIRIRVHAASQVIACPKENEMARAHRVSMTGAVIVCLVSTQWHGTLFASEEERASREAPSSQSLTSTAPETQASTSVELGPAISIDEHSAPTTDLSSALPQMERSRFTLDARAFNFVPTRSSAFAGQIYRGRPYRMARDGSIAAIMVGAVVAITGAAILVYANRPECDDHRFAGGCGYGTKVVGGAVLSGGVVSLVVGALTWR
jgi:hypothetical protein